MEEENSKIWKRLARNFQQTSSNMFGDRMFDRVSGEQLTQKVGYALYNNPTEVDEINKTATYTITQQNHITLVCEMLKSQQPSEDGLFYFSCIYVFIRFRNKNKDVGVQVVFRIPKFEDNKPSENSFIFLDPKPRKYDSWEIYLEKNKLPKCDMCFPTNGIYTEYDKSVNLTFAPSNSCKTSTAILNGLDVSSTVLLVGATGISLASLAFPIAAPVVWGAAATVIASGSYDAARKVYSLHDIKKHGESLGIKNPEARSAWLNLAGSVVGMASVGATAVAKSVVATESVISRTGILTLRLLNVSSLAVNGLGVFNGIVTLIIKYRNGTLEIKDVLHFTYVCFFLLNAVVTYNIASTLLEELACSDLKTMFNLRTNSCYQFTKDVVEYSNMNSLSVLRSLISGIQSKFYPDINIDDLESMILTVFVSLLKLSNGTMKWEHFSKEMIFLFSNIWERYQNVILKVIEEVECTFAIPYWQSVLPRQIITNLEIPRLMCEEGDKVIETCGINRQSIEHRNLMTFARAFSLNRVENENEFINRFKFYCECIVAQFREEVETYENQLDSRNGDQGFSREDFDKSYGIQGRKEDFFVVRAMDKVNHPEFLGNIDELYSSCLPNTQPVDSQLPFLKTMKSKIYTFYGILGQTILESSFYWKKVSDLTGFQVDPRNCTLCNKDNFVLIQPKPDHTSSELAELEAVLINTSLINGCHMGLLLLLLK